MAEENQRYVSINEQVVVQLAATITNMSTVLEAHGTQTEKLNFFREELGDVRDSLRRIVKVLLEGNGDKPLLSRTAILEAQVEHLTALVAYLKQEEDDEKKTIETNRTIARKGKWTLAAALIAGVTGIIASIISFLK